MRICLMSFFTHNLQSAERLGTYLRLFVKRIWWLHPFVHARFCRVKFKQNLERLEEQLLPMTTCNLQGKQTGFQR